MLNKRIQGLLPQQTIESFEGQFVTTAITGYGQVIAQVGKYDKATNTVKLTVFTPRGIMPLTVSLTDMYGIAPYSGPLPGMGGMGQQGGMGQMGGMGQQGGMGQMGGMGQGGTGQMGQMGQMGQTGQMGQMGGQGQGQWPWPWQGQGQGQGGWYQWFPWSQRS